MSSGIQSGGNGRGSSARSGGGDSSNGDHARILLVEDEGLLRKPVLALLREEGFEVVPATNGVEALEIYRREPRAIALVVLDVHLPGLDGFQVFRRMKELDADVAVLFVSGNVGESSRHQLLASGAMGYLAKPYRIEALVAKIRESLERRAPLD
jgi:two-component system, cell cycle sensor histidine kinase and response regulator CckA